MNRQTILIVVSVVVLVHLAFFYVFSHMRALPKTTAKPVPPPNFGVSEGNYVDAETGEKFTYREIRVSTKLIDPAELKRIEAQRAARAAATPTP